MVLPPNMVIIDIDPYQFLRLHKNSVWCLTLPDISHFPSEVLRWSQVLVKMKVATVVGRVCACVTSLQQEKPPRCALWVHDALFPSFLPSFSSSYTRNCYCGYIRWLMRLMSPMSHLLNILIRFQISARYTGRTVAHPFHTISGFGSCMGLVSFFVRAIFTPFS